MTVISGTFSFSENNVVQQLKLWGFIGFLSLCVFFAVSLFIHDPKELDISFAEINIGNYKNSDALLTELKENGKIDRKKILSASGQYVLKGDIVSAASILSSFVKQQSDDYKMRELLGIYLKKNMQDKEYLENLEEISSIKITPHILKELEKEYSVSEQTGKIIKVLKKKIEMFPYNHETFLKLARILAGNKCYYDAIKVIKKLKEYHSEKVTIDAIEILINSFLETGQSEKAFIEARDWLSENFSPKNLISITEHFVFKGFFEQALHLIEPHSKIADKNPEILAMFMRMLEENGRADEAYIHMLLLHTEQRLPEKAAPVLVKLALKDGDISQAFHATRDIELSVLPDWLLSLLARAVLNSDSIEYAKKMTKRMGNMFLRNRPVLAAQLALAGKDYHSFNLWIEFIEALPYINAQQRISLADLYIRTEKKDKAISLMRSLSEKSYIPDWAFIDLSLIYIKLKKVKEGLSLFNEMLSRKHTIGVEKGWALLAAKKGKIKETSLWLDGVAKKHLDTDFLLSLYRIASRNEKSTLALSTGEHLFRRRRSADDKLRLIRSLVEETSGHKKLANTNSLINIKPDVNSILNAARHFNKAGAPNLVMPLTKVAAAIADNETKTLMDIDSIETDAAVLALNTTEVFSYSAMPEKDDFANEYTLSASMLADDIEKASLTDDKDMEEQTELSRKNPFSEMFSPAKKITLASARQALKISDTLLADRHSASALPLLRKTFTEAPLNSYAYIAALYSATRTDEPLGAELSEYWLTKLKTPETTLDEKKQAISVLFKLKAHRDILPVLKKLVTERENDWFDIYVDITEKTGNITELKRFLEKEIKRPNLSQEQMEKRLDVLMKHENGQEYIEIKRDFSDRYKGKWFIIYTDTLKKAGHKKELADYLYEKIKIGDVTKNEKHLIAMHMLELGRKQFGENLLKALATNEKAKGKNVLQLLKLWGKKPTDEQIEWIQSRAQNAIGSEKAEWMQHLINLNRPELATALIGPMGVTETKNDKLIRTFIDALVLSKNVKRLANVLSVKIESENSSENLMFYAETAYMHGLLSIAGQAYKKALENSPNNSTILEKYKYLDFQF